MKVSKQLAWLGVATSIIWEEKSGEELHGMDWPAWDETGKKCWLLCTGDGKKVFLLEPAKVKDVEIPNGHQATKNMFKRWSGFNDTDGAWNFTIPSDSLKKCGRIVEIRYDSDKWSGKPTRYVHRYERTPLASLYRDKKKNPRALGIADTKKRRLVTARGLIG